MVGPSFKQSPTPGEAMVFKAEPQAQAFSFVGFDECDERLRETHHRVKNNLQMIASLLAMQARQDSPSAREALALAANRIMAVAKLHEQLQRGGGYPVDAADYLGEVCGSLAVGAGCEDRGVELEVVAVDAEVSGGQATALGLIVTELVTNALKHAFVARGGRIRVALSRDPAGLRLTVADDGPGLSVGAAQGLGLALVRQMVGKLGGAMDVESDAGAVFHVRFPV
jgi:two-component sensor histidine kinase